MHFMQEQTIWVVLKKTISMGQPKVEVESEHYDYLVALAVCIEKRKKCKGNPSFKLVSRENEKNIDLNNKAIMANFR